MASVDYIRISIRELQVRRPGVDGHIYKGMNLDVLDGKVTGIFGPNGVGKSTLIRLLLGFTTGLQTNWKTAVKEHIPTNYVSNSPQKYSESLMPWLTVQDNIALPLTAVGRSRRESHQSATSLLELFSFAHKEALPSQLSGGQQQMVTLLRTLSRLPDLLLLDEPFSALDIYTGARFRDQFFEYIKVHHLSTVFVTHDSNELFRYCDRVLLLGPDNLSAEYDLTNARDRQSVADQLRERPSDGDPVKIPA